MLSGDSEPAPIDARLVDRFALFREDLPGADGSLEDAEAQAIVRMAEFGGDYAFARTTKVILADGLTFLVVPGPDGVLMLPPFDGGGTAAIGASTDSLLRALPVGSSGSLVFGLAADGVLLQPVALSDGSTVQAPVRRNVYAVTDPARG